MSKQAFLAAALWIIQRCPSVLAATQSGQGGKMSLFKPRAHFSNSPAIGSAHLDSGQILPRYSPHPRGSQIGQNGLNPPIGGGLTLTLARLARLGPGGVPKTLWVRHAFPRMARRGQHSSAAGADSRVWESAPVGKPTVARLVIPRLFVVWGEEPRTFYKAGLLRVLRRAEMA